MHFDSTLTLGNVLTILAIILTALRAIYKMSVQYAANMQRLDSMQSQLVSIQNEISKLGAIQAQLSADRELIALLETRIQALEASQASRASALGHLKPLKARRSA